MLRASASGHRSTPRPSVTTFGPAEPLDADSNFAQPWTYTTTQLVGVVRGDLDTRRRQRLGRHGGRNGEEAQRDGQTSSTQRCDRAYRFGHAREDTIVSADAGVRARLEMGFRTHPGAVGSRVERVAQRYAFRISRASPANSQPRRVPPQVANFCVGAPDNPLVTERTETSSVAVDENDAVQEGRLMLPAGARWQSIENPLHYNTCARTSATGRAVTRLAVLFKQTRRSRSKPTIPRPCPESRAGGQRGVTG